MERSYAIKSLHLEMHYLVACETISFPEVYGILPQLTSLLRVPWTARRSNQSILKKISPGCSLEGLMLKLKLQYFGHLM